MLSFYFLWTFIKDRIRGPKRRCLYFNSFNLIQHNKPPTPPPFLDCEFCFINIYSQIWNMFKQNFLMFSYYFIYSLLYSNYSKGFGDDIIKLVRGMLGPFPRAQWTPIHPSRLILINLLQILECNHALSVW